MKRLLAVLSILFFLVSCGGFSKQNEREPNNSFSEAQTVSLNRPVRGHIDSLKDSDYYQYECEKAQTVSITLTALKGINHDISVFKAGNSKPVLVKRIDDSRKSSPEKFPSFGLTPGKWYFVIAHGDRDKPAGNRKNSYLFTVSQVKSHEEDEGEPNDTIRNASALIAGTPVTGYFSQSFNKLNTDKNERFIEYDYFFCEASEGGTMADIEISAVPGVDSVIEVLSSGGRLLLRSDSGAVGAGEHISGQGIRANGRFYLRVYAKNFGSNYKEAYTLKIELGGFEEGVELEPNNAVEEATSLQSTMKGSIVPENDQDVFRVDPQADAQIRNIVVMPSSELDVWFSVYDSNSILLAEINSGGAGAQELFAGIRVQSPVYVLVKGSGKSETEQQFYHIRAEIANDQQNAETEPNNSMEQAQPISGQISGYLSYKGDTDYYIYEHEGRTEVIITLSHAAADNAALSVTDNLGYVIRTVPTENGTLILNEVVNDRFYIVVETSGNGSQQSYSLTVEDKE